MAKWWNSEEIKTRVKKEIKYFHLKLLFAIYLLASNMLK